MQTAMHSVFEAFFIDEPDPLACEFLQPSTSQGVTQPSIVAATARQIQVKTAS